LVENGVASKSGDRRESVAPDGLSGRQAVLIETIAGRVRKIVFFLEYSLFPMRCLGSRLV